MQGLALKLSVPVIRYQDSGCFTLASSTASQADYSKGTLILTYASN